ncbi:MAG TPA: tetratricopeptide repeat protein [Bacteroidia bacterium]|nr:tetratricopeptide repeat protein [Bacteroidia bacterium]
MPVRGKILFYFFLLICPLFAQTKKIDSLQVVLKENQPDTERVNTLNQLSVELRGVDQMAAEEYAKESMDLAGSIDFEKGLARAYTCYGIARGDQGNIEEEIIWQEKALAVYTKLGDKAGMAKSLNNIAVCEYYLGSFTEAFDHTMQSARLYEELNDKWGLAVVNMSLGNITLEQKDYNRALTYYEAALKANGESANDEMMEARILGNIGNVHFGRNDFEKAYESYAKTLAFFENNNRGYEQAVMLNNMGEAMSELGNPKTALVPLRKSLTIRLRLNDSDGICTSYQSLGEAMSNTGKHDSAVFYFRAAIRIAQNMHSKAQEVTAYLGIAEAYARMKKFEDAYAYLDKYRTLNDSILGSESASAINALRSKYEQQKHQQKIDLLENERKLQQEHAQRNVMLLITILLGVSLVSIVLFNRSRRKQLINEQLERKNLEITLQKNAITDSINYAKKIQDSILPPDNLVKTILPDSFVLYLPKDVVSGDFYWVEKRDGKAVFAAVDCTGHGVPGALMSVVGFNLLTQAVNELGLTKPADILHHLDFGVNKLLRQSDKDSAKDGMDLALCTLDSETKILQYAGVFNPAYIIRGGKLEQLKPDKYPIGINTDGVTDDYTNQEIQLASGDMVYLFSDGYADQFGGPAGKKFMYNRFRELLKKIHALSTQEQKQRLTDEFLIWKGAHEQVDDILVIGVRVK